MASEKHSLLPLDEEASPRSIPNSIPALEYPESVFDIRDYLWLLIFTVILSPVALSLLSFSKCLLLVTLIWGLPSLIRLKYPTFMMRNTTDELSVDGGATLSLVASMSALLLQAHNSTISVAVEAHSDFYTRPLVRYFKTILFVEMAFYGSSEEKEQTASWLRWIHRHVHGSITPEMHEKFGIPEDVDSYGYINELKAYILEAMTWATISFQDRFGRKLSKRGKDSVVLSYMCIGLRLGVPQSFLARDYDSFLISFNHRLDRQGSGSELTRSIVEAIENSLGQSRSRFSIIFFYCAMLVGQTLLPGRVKSLYRLNLLNSKFQRALQKILCAALWLLYPLLMSMSLRGMISLLLVLEPQLRVIMTSSLAAIHSMDIINDKPLRGKSQSGPDTSTPSDLPSYTQWLVSGKDHSLLNAIVSRTLEAQLRHNQFRAWLAYPLHVTTAIFDAIPPHVREVFRRCRLQILESRLFHSGEEIKLPVHIGLVMDGNRRFARQLGQPVIKGHIKGAATASSVLEWWLTYLPNTAHYTIPMLPKYLTCWAFSSDNFKRPAEEQDGLFRLMAAELKSLAFAPAIHLFRIRVRIIGSGRHLLPRELLETIFMLEQVTAEYEDLFLQIAVGYGGRQEVVESIQNLLEQGKPITEKSIGMETFCAKINVPPCDLIVRTSERRTSGFFLWDTQGAELHFIDKLWPELNEKDWLEALGSFSKREMRWGK